MHPTQYVSKKTGTIRHPDTVKRKTHPKLAKLDKEALANTKFLANPYNKSVSNNNNQPTETDAECADIIIKQYKETGKKDNDHRCYEQLKEVNKEDWEYKYTSEDYGTLKQIFPDVNSFEDCAKHINDIYTSTNTIDKAHLCYKRLKNANKKDKEKWETISKKYSKLKDIFPDSKFKKGDKVYYGNLEVEITEVYEYMREYEVKFVDKKEIIINKKDLKQIVQKKKVVKNKFFGNKTEYYFDRIDVDPKNLLDGDYRYNNERVIPIAYSGDYYKIRFSDSIVVKEDQLKKEINPEDELQEEENLSENIKTELAKTEEDLNKARKEKKRLEEEEKKKKAEQAIKEIEKQMKEENSLNYLRTLWNEKKEKERLKKEEAIPEKEKGNNGMFRGGNRKSKKSSKSKKSKKSKKTKKGKKSRKARKSRRKSNRRRSRR